MIPPISTTKSKIDFSIDWIVKNDKITKNLKDSVNLSNNNNINLPMDYETEISKALRITPDSIHRDLMHNPDTLSKIPIEDYLEKMNKSYQTQDPIRPMPLLPPRMQSSQDMQTLQSIQHSEFVAAQLQLAAALSHRHQAAQQFSADNKYGQPMHLSHLLNQSFQRTTYPIQPWLINRHGRIFPHGFSGDFLLHPFRKPKRVRTAFAPLQLLKLEHAFEGNQYVVGTERKALAKTLNLSETQVKVWFQNRRTKHKRMLQEEDTKGGSEDECSQATSSSNISKIISEDIDMNNSDDYDNL